jgi:hypothetical protein
MPPLYKHNIISNLRKNADYIKFLTLSSNHVGLDFGTLIDALRTNRTLQQVHFHAKFLAFLTAKEVETLLEACASLPRLQELSVSLPANRAHLSFLVVDRCVTKCPPLRKLILTGFDHKACLSLSACLAHHPSLVDVQLLEGAKKAAHPHFFCQGPSFSAVSAMASALQHTRLQNLVVKSSNLHSDDIVAMANALAFNTTLQRLDLSSSSSSSSSCSSRDVNYHPLLNVFAKKQNERLQSLKTDAPVELQTALDFYTQLNASGATQLLTHAETVSRSEWLNVIISIIIMVQTKKNHNVDDDLSVLFYTLTQEPTILLSYSPARDKQAHQRPLSLLLRQHNKAHSAPKKSHNLNTTSSSRRRQKPVNAPFCWALNVPM